MKIALVGAHNTGKTTLFNKMYGSHHFAGYEFFREVVREVQNLGFVINEGADDATQLAMCALHLNHLKYQSFVTDRCLLDNLVYAWVLSSGENPTVSLDCVKTIDSYFRKTKDDIDLYIYCPIEFEMENDGVRTVNKEFQQIIDRTFNYMLKSISEDKILRVSGPSDERFKQVVNRLAQ